MAASRRSAAWRIYDPTLPGNVGTTPSSRIRDLLIDENGNVIVKLVDNGVILQDVPSLITVTLNSLPRRRWLPSQPMARISVTQARDGTLSAPVNEALDFTSAAGFAGGGTTAADVLGEQRRFRILSRTSAPVYNTPTPRSRVTFAYRTRRFVTPCRRHAVNLNGGPATIVSMVRRSMTC
jgi:hypothetical protein